MADLAKYGEVEHVYTCSDEFGGISRLRKLLADGWELITAKVVEAQERVPRGGVWYIRKRAEAHYVLGRRRDYKTPEELEKARRIREEEDGLGQVNL